MRQKTTNITFAAMQHGKDIFHILSMSHISECPEKSQKTWRNTSFAMDLWFMILLNFHVVTFFSPFIFLLVVFTVSMCLLHSLTSNIFSAFEKPKIFSKSQLHHVVLEFMNCLVNELGLNFCVTQKIKTKKEFKV